MSIFTTGSQHEMIHAFLFVTNNDRVTLRFFLYL